MKTRYVEDYRVKENEIGWFVIQSTKAWRDDHTPVWEDYMIWSKPLGLFRPQKRREPFEDYWKNKREHECRMARFLTLKEARIFIKKLKKGFPIYHES
jgi:hypothetical protein